MALSLLLAVALIYVLTRYLTDLQGLWGFVNAFSEAAMVGAFADWFAVTAIFRHPMGIRIPHAAIVPRKKAQLGTQFVRYTSEHIRTNDPVMPRLEDAQLAPRVDAW